MGGTGVSKSQVSRLITDIDERVNAFLDRPIEGEWPYLWIDATYLKEREGGRIVSTAVIVAVGVNTLGKREVLGVASGPSEAEPFWKGFLRSLADRGLRGVKLVISDDHKGLRSARQGLPCNRAALSRALDAQCFGICRSQKASRCRRHAQDDLCPGERRSRPQAVAPHRRCPA
jgi:hypothetical protein